MTEQQAIALIRAFLSLQRQKVPVNLAKFKAAVMQCSSAAPAPKTTPAPTQPGAGGWSRIQNSPGTGGLQTTLGAKQTTASGAPVRPVPATGTNAVQWNEMIMCAVLYFAAAQIYTPQASDVQALLRMLSAKGMVPTVGQAPTPSQTGWKVTEGV